MYNAVCICDDRMTCADSDKRMSQTLSACYRGYGCGIVEIRLAPGTVYSDKAIINRVLPSSADDMRSRQRDYVESNFCLRQAFQTDNVPFVIEKCQSSAYCVPIEVCMAESCLLWL